MDPGRRVFLAAAALAPVAGVRGPRLAGVQGERSPEKVAGMTPEKRVIPRISLAQWSFHRTIRTGKLDNLDFAALAKRDFGLEGVEYVNQFFAEKGADFGYLGQMRKRAEDSGVASLLIMIDGEGPLAAEETARRDAAVGAHFKWIAAAAYLGCQAIRVNAQGSGPREVQLDLMADSLRRLGDVGAEYAVDVLVENHGGLSSDGAWLAAVMKKTAHPRVGTLPDFGNFTIGEGEVYDRYRGIEELLPFAKALSAKSHDFDAQGNETSTDYARMAKLALAAGYAGWVGVEYEGDRLPEPEGVRKTIELVGRAWAEVQGAK